MPEPCRIAGVRISGEDVYFHWSSGAPSMIVRGKYSPVMPFELGVRATVLVTRLPTPMSKKEAMEHLLTQPEFTNLPGVKDFLERQIRGAVKHVGGTAAPVADTATSSEYYIYSDSDRVEAWSAWHLPYMNKT